MDEVPTVNKLIYLKQFNTSLLPIHINIAVW
ncbi:MAG: hypothetical protein K0Q97_1075 [Bacillota bacterium]|jgi:hypothetical protein|nr:hypothetical protein [Bacillota bacterium]